MEVMIVIPSAFKQFSENPNLMPYDKLLSLLHRNGASADELVGRRLIAGQGLDDMQVDHAWYVGTSRGLVNEFADWRAARKGRYADRTLCHKHRPENILISVPEQQPDGAYTADLLLHERNEFMLDHLTGQHIQGMVLTEACRQMFLAVTERYCLDHNQAVKRYFVINSMNVRYQAFAFPLPAQIRYQVIDQQQPKPERVSIHADMDVLQAGQVVAGMEVKFTVFDDAYISRRESKLAAEAVGNYVNWLRSELTGRSENLQIDTTTMVAAQAPSPVLSLASHP